MKNESVRAYKLRSLQAATIMALLLLPLSSFAAPQLRVISPTEEAVLVEKESVVVQFEAKGYLFVDHAGNAELYPADPEAGHAHLWIDPPAGSRVHAAARKLLGAGPVDLGVLDPGAHEVIIELAANDHSSLIPPLLQHRRFFVGYRPVAIGEDSTSQGLIGGLVLFAVVAGLLLYRFRHKIFKPRKPEAS